MFYLMLLPPAWLILRVYECENDARHPQGDAPTMDPSTGHAPSSMVGAREFGELSTLYGYPGAAHPHERQVALRI